MPSIQAKLRIFFYDIRRVIKRKLRSWFGLNNYQYRNLTFTRKEIANEKYKAYLGGGKKSWDKRGEFQLLMMKNLGLDPAKSFLDAGCGPIRAGRFFIDYLDTGNYFGMDSNTDFISISKSIVAEDKRLQEKQPAFAEVINFNFGELERTFDYILVWSVLNHCNQEERLQFFNNIRAICHANSRIVLTHIGWLESSYLSNSGLCIEHEYKTSQDIHPDLNIKDYGWEKGSDAFPLKVLKPKNEI